MSYANVQETGRPIDIKDEGITISHNVKSIDFVGAGITGSAVGVDVKEEVPNEGTVTSVGASGSDGVVVSVMNPTTSPVISVSLGAITPDSLAISTMTPGSVAFFGAGGLLSQDNANLFWDASDKRLGIGTNTPNTPLQVANYLNLGDDTGKSIFIGKGTGGSSSTGEGNVAIGYGVFAHNTTGNNNMAIGDEALLNNTTGYGNVAIGDSALYTNTTGQGNTAIGTGSLISSSAADFNVGIGRSAGFSNQTGNSNTSVGHWAHRYATSGNYNSAFGESALEERLTGDENTALGWQSGKRASISGHVSLTTGTGNTFVGSGAGVTVDGISRSVAIGYHAAVGQSDAIVLGDTSNASVKVGIGLDKPGAKLTIRTGSTDPGTYDDGLALFVSHQSSGANASIAEFRHDNLSQGVGIGYASVFATGNSANQALEVFSRGTSPLYFNTSGGGNVGIGLAAPTATLEVAGGVKVWTGLSVGGPTEGVISGGLLFNRAGGEPFIKLQQDNAGGGQIRGLAAGGFRFTGPGAAPEWMRITNSGYVGIGTTTPSSLLSVGSSSQFQVDSTGAISAVVGLTSSSSVVCATAALATSATNGFLYIPTCAGTPTGVPTAKTGTVPLVFDTTNNRLYVYSGGTWL